MITTLPAPDQSKSRIDQKSVNCFNKQTTSHRSQTTILSQKLKEPSVSSVKTMPKPKMTVVLPLKLKSKPSTKSKSSQTTTATSNNSFNLAMFLSIIFRVVKLTKTDNQEKHTLFVETRRPIKSSTIRLSLTLLCIYLASGVEACVSTDCGDEDAWGGTCNDVINCDGLLDTDTYIEDVDCCSCGGGVSEICVAGGPIYNSANFYVGTTLPDAERTWKPPRNGYQIAFAGVESWITNNNNCQVSWPNTLTNADAGQYNLVGYVYSACSTDSYSLELTVYACNDGQLDVSTSIWTDKEYYVKDAEITSQWTCQDTGLAGCESVIWSLTMNDGSPLDTNVFTLVNFDSSLTKELRVYTTDYTKAGIYDLKTTVAYVNLPDVQKTVLWQYEIKLCDGTIDADETIWEDATYYITDDAMTLPWTPQVAGITECGDYTWTLTMSDDTIPVPSLFTKDFTLSTKTLEIYQIDDTYEDMYDFKVTVTYDRHTSVFASAYFSVDVIACQIYLDVQQPLFLSGEYYVRDVLKTLTWTPRETGNSECGDLTWTLTMEADDSDPDVDVFPQLDFTESTKTLQIYARLDATINMYTLKVKVYYNEHLQIYDLANFSIEVKECFSSTLDADASIWLDDFYYVRDVAKILTWTPQATGITECGAISWTLTMTVDGSVPDTNVFPSLDFRASTKTLEILALTDYYLGTYAFEVTVLYDNHPGVEAYASFSIKVKECFSSTLNADTYIWQDDSYSILDGAKSLNWTPQETGIIECGDVIWSLSMSNGNSPDTHVFPSFDFTSSTKTLKIYSIEASYAGTYYFKVTVFYERHANVQSHAFFSIDVTSYDDQEAVLAVENESLQTDEERQAEQDLAFDEELDKLSNDLLNAAYLQVQSKESEAEDDERENTQRIDIEGDNGEVQSVEGQSSVGENGDVDDGDHSGEEDRVAEDGDYSVEEDRVAEDGDYSVEEDRVAEDGDYSLGENSDADDGDYNEREDGDYSENDEEEKGSPGGDTEDSTPSQSRVDEVSQDASEDGQTVSVSLTEDDFKDFVIEVIIPLNGTSKVAFELHFDELINNATIEQLFKDASINQLPFAQQQLVLKKVIKYSQTYLTTMAQHTKQQTELRAPEIAFTNIESNGDCTLGLEEAVIGMQYINELKIGMTMEGKVSDVVYDAAHFARLAQGSRQLTSSDNTSRRSLQADSVDFDLSDFLSFTIYRGAENSAEQKLLDYNVTSRYIDSQQLEFYLEFADPLLVSSGTTNDVLIATVVDGSMFASAVTGIEIDPDFFMHQVLPKMLPDTEFTIVMVAAAEVVEKGVQIGLISQTVISIILAVSMKTLWNFLNVVQVLAYLRSFASWSAIMDFMLVQMDHAITLQPIVDRVLDYEKSRFDKIKEASLNDSFIKQNGIFVLALIVIIIGTVVYLLLKFLIKSPSPLVIKLRESIKKKLFFSSIYRYLLISNLKIIASLLLVSLVTEWSLNTVMDKVEYFAYSLGIFGFMMWPVFIMIFLNRNFENLEEPEFKKKHESIYQRIKTDKRQALLYNSIFSVRRFLLVMINVQWSPRLEGDTNNYLFKAVFFILLQTFYVLYIFDTKPHKGGIHNTLEFINEFALILLGYVMLIFSGLTPIADLLANHLSYKTAEMSGVAIAVVIFLTNFFVMGKELIDKVKNSLAQRKLKKAIKQKHTIAVQLQPVTVNRPQALPYTPKTILTQNSKKSLMLVINELPVKYEASYGDIEEVKLEIGIDKLLRQDKNIAIENESSGGL